MTIAILPPRLANQIAAGEVVERPASVVKELVENSIDAGATNIVIDIEQGGHKRIRISDNGKGIYKDELSLALSRHATSKIKDLDDLESIASLGFRGEALASISSVSRLTLTSKPAEQNNAWQAMASGREMQVDIQPAAHPDGTTIDVEDLFFNTPARRKFLRTHKTEFSHIDEVIRRIALSKLQISFILNHNGKTIRQYRAANTDKQVEKRLASICSQSFVNHAIAVDFEHQGLHLYGWVANPEFTRSQNDLCYSYVNGRMMRDKLINHAIRQAYGERLPHDAYPAFVLFLDLEFDQVDVNVHPAKHEVRFHQARFVHDFIVSAISRSLQQDWVDESAHDVDEIAEPPFVDHSEYAQSLRPANPDSQHTFQNQKTPYSAQAPTPGNQSSPAYFRDKPSKRALANYDELLKTEVAPGLLQQSQESSSSQRFYSSSENLQTDVYAAPSSIPIASSKSDCQVIKLAQKNTAVVLNQNTLFLIDTEPFIFEYQLLKIKKAFSAPIISQPLLLPVALSFESKQFDIIQRYQQQLIDTGIELELKSGGKCVIRQYPALLRALDVQSSFEQIITLLESGDHENFDWPGCFARLLCQSPESVGKLQSIVDVLSDCGDLDFFALFDLNCIELDLTSYIQQLKQPSE